MQMSECEKNRLLATGNFLVAKGFEDNFDDITNLFWCQKSRELLTDFLTAKKPLHWQQLH